MFLASDEYLSNLLLERSRQLSSHTQLSLPILVLQNLYISFSRADALTFTASKVTLSQIHPQNTAAMLLPSKQDHFFDSSTLEVVFIKSKESFEKQARSCPISSWISCSTTRGIPFVYCGVGYTNVFSVAFITFPAEQKGSDLILH